MVRIASVVLVLMVGCISDRLVPCGDQLCPVGDVCTSGGCASVEAVNACATKAEGDPCSTTAIAQGYCTGGACRQSVCGDGIVEHGEACDDGNVDSGDGCSARCDSDETCGNDIVDVLVGEQCDSGVPGLSGDGCTSTCTVELDGWSEVTPSPLLGRRAASVAFDSARGRTVMFGGLTVAGRVAATWEWDDVTWVQRFPRHAPPARSSAAMAYDPVRRVTVLFGGLNTSNVELDDTWEWDGIDWKARVSATTPTTRQGAMIAYDTPGHRIFMFGGTRGAAVFGDMWTWDGTDWAKLTGAHPPPRYSGGIAASATAIVIAGGSDNTGDLADSWSWNGSAWTQLATAPTARHDSSLAYDATNGRYIVYGGISSLATLLSDTWSCDGTTWTQLSPTTSPLANYGVALGTDPNGGVVLFGGKDSGGFRMETMKLTVNWVKQAGQQLPLGRIDAAVTADPLHGTVIVSGGNNYSSASLSDAFLWDGEQWHPILGTQPSRRTGASMVYDRTRGTAVMFGGLTPSGATNETWTFDGAAWTKLTPTNSPPPSYQSGFAYDDARRVAVLFANDGSTWTWDGVDWSHAMPAVSPSPRLTTAMTYDAATAQVVLFGGLDGSGMTYGDTWTWDGTSWTEQQPMILPAPRSGHRLAYNERTKLVMMFGGLGLGFLDDTWTWDGANWTQLRLADAPAPRAGQAMAFDATHNRLVVFSGDHGSDIGTDSQVWLYGFASAAYPPDACDGTDSDGDGLVGCADPDCTPRCAPLCRPGDPCDPALPRCGDGVCSVLEDSHLCPADCPPP